ncbi:hypothetical protein [Cohnella hongkongensis]|uniref:DUF2281 domain-containing protein n=1 Tax=Cohnella hongkongensis TaxID=178337 RepID=A0ABV9FGV2_9BACL
MSINREELKRIIDHIPEQDAIEVADFIGCLNAKREREALKKSRTRQPDQHGILE